MPNKKLFKVLNEKFKELSNKEKVLSTKGCLKIKYVLFGDVRDVTPKF